MGEMITTKSARVQEILEHSRAVRETAARRKNWETLRAQKRGRAPLEPVVRCAWPARPLWEVLPDGSWFSQPCFIVGGGPSLKGFEFERLRGAGRVVAINKAFKDVPFADVLFAMDYPFLEDIVRGKFGEEYRLAFMHFLGMKVWVDLSGYGYPEDIFVVPSAGEHGWTKSLKDGLCHGQNSGYGALNLAIVLGANPIFLLGYDMKKGPEGATHYHEGYTTGVSAGALDAYRKNFEEGAALLKDGPRIINLNPQSALKCFELGDVDAVLESSIKMTNLPGNRVTAITPTGDRPLAFQLCQEWMKNQMRKPDQWIVVDDGKMPFAHSGTMLYVRREPRLDDPKYTLDLNMAAALPFITGDKIIIIEDDEYYAPSYIEEMVRRLDTHEVVGICRSKYYHLPTGGYVQIGNAGHASLAETGFRASFLPAFVGCINRGIVANWLDTQIWKIAKKDGLFVDSAAPLYVGIKGLPGRAGMGVGHTMKYPTKDTADRAMLKKWIPKDYQVYLDVLAGMK